MPQSQAWWADVQHLREDFERRDRARAEGLPRRRSSGAAAPQRRTNAPESSQRRTIEIRGHAVPAPDLPRLVEVERRRAPRAAIDRPGPRPDRVAMWALLMGIMLIMVAAATSHAAV